MGGRAGGAVGECVASMIGVRFRVRVNNVKVKARIKFKREIHYHLTRQLTT